jgi:hypothetical protein
MTMKASKAPGSKALRDLGCHQAAIFDADEAGAYFESIGQLTRDQEGGALEVPLVMCAVRPKETLDCETVTKTYAGAVENPPEEMMVMVQSQGFPQRSLCAGFYKSDGTLIEVIPMDR